MIYICIYTCIQLCVYVYIFTHLYMYTCIHTLMHVCVLLLFDEQDYPKWSKTFTNPDLHNVKLYWAPHYHR